MSRPAPVPPPLPADPQPVLLDGGSRAWALAAAGLALLPLLLTLPPQLGAGFGVLAPVVALLAWRRPLPGWLVNAYTMPTGTTISLAGTAHTPVSS